MKLSRFHWSAKSIRADGALSALTSGKTPILYRQFEGKWYAESGMEEVSANLIAQLEKCRTSSVAPYWRAAKQKYCLFRIDALDAVVLAEFPSSPRQPTQQRYHQLVSACFSNSQNAFDAVHDQLTTLPNRRGFEDLLRKALKSAGLPSAIPAIASVQVVEQRAIALLSLDIDYFKQINDAHGHQYGDVVLAAFAWRISSISEQMSSSHKVGITIGRVGGEEFAMLFTGLRDQAQAMEIAEELRRSVARSVADRELPTDEEWRVLTKTISVSASALPARVDRRVTCSFGHAALPRIDLPLNDEQLQAAITQFLRESDTALYRAKLDGRNCVRSFREILDRLGRVIEHHGDTDIVAIDVGSDVGVKNGQEFLVFHPQFTGESAFYFSDGRTKKRLGQYPRYSSGRVSVFKVEREISFCNVLSNSLKGQFPVGSRLENVPLGSFTHLVATRPGVGGLVLDNYGELRARCRESVADKKKVTAISIAVRDLGDMEERKGVFMANEALAALYKAIVLQFSSDINVSSPSPGEFAFLIEGDVNPNEDVLREKLEKILDEQRGIGKCVAGIYLSTEQPEHQERNIEAVELARLAAHGVGPIVVYDDGTPDDVVQSWRAQGKLDDAVADYLRFRACGLNLADLENKGGLCYLETPTPNFVRAIICFDRAVQLAPEESIYAVNLGYTYWRSGNVTRSFQFLSPQHEYLAAYAEKGGAFVGYFAAYVEGAMQQYGTSPPQIDPARLHQILSWAGKYDLSGWLTAESISNVKATLRASNKIKVNSVQLLSCSCFGEGTWRANWSMMNCGT